MKKLSILFFIVVTLISSQARSEPFITAEKIIKSLAVGQRMDNFLPCTFLNFETECALIHTGNTTSDEFRVYSYNNDATLSAKVIYSFKPGIVGGAQNLLGILSSTPPSHSVKTFWTLPGVHSEGQQVEIIITANKSGQFSAVLKNHRIIKTNE